MPALCLPTELGGMWGVTLLSPLPTDTEAEGCGP